MNISISTPIYANGKVVGEVHGDTFRKKIKFSLHALRRPPALAFDMTSLQAAQAAGARIVEVYDKESSRAYRASIATIRQHGFEFNRGFGNQIALPLARWAVTGGNAESATIGTSSGETESSATQLGMFA